MSVRIAKNSGKNIVIVSPNMTLFALATLYISVVHFHMSISEIAIFILILVRLIPTSQAMANQRQQVAASRPSLHKVIDVIKEITKINKKIYILAVIL